MGGGNGLVGWCFKGEFLEPVLLFVFVEFRRNNSAYVGFEELSVLIVL